MALTKSGEFLDRVNTQDGTDSSTDRKDEFPGTSEQEDLATASGADMTDAIADWMSDRRGEARADTTADVDPETDPGRSAIGAAAGLFESGPSDTPTRVDIDTSESGEITDVDTSNTVESADDDPHPTKDTTPDRGVEADKKTATGSGGGGGGGSSTSDTSGGGGGGGGSSTSDTSDSGGSKKRERSAPKVVKVPFPVPRGVKTQDSEGQTGVPMQLVLIGLVGVGALVYLSADGGAGGAGGAGGGS